MSYNSYSTIEFTGSALTDVLIYVVNSTTSASESTVLVEDTMEIPIRPFSSRTDISGNACQLQPVTALGIEDTQVWEVKSNASDQNLTLSLVSEHCQSANLFYEATSSSLTNTPVSLDWVDTSDNSLIVKTSEVNGTTY